MNMESVPAAEESQAAPTPTKKLCILVIDDSATIRRSAESMLASNKPADASAIYKTFDQASQPRLVRLAAARGLLACASKQA